MGRSQVVIVSAFDAEDPNHPGVDVWELTFVDREAFDGFIMSCQEGTTLGLGGIFGILNVVRLEPPHQSQGGLNAHP